MCMHMCLPLTLCMSLCVRGCVTVRMNACAPVYGWMDGWCVYVIMYACIGWGMPVCPSIRTYVWDSMPVCMYVPCLYACRYDFVCMYAVCLPACPSGVLPVGMFDVRVCIHVCMYRYVSLTVYLYVWLYVRVWNTPLNNCPHRLSVSLHVSVCI